MQEEAALGSLCYMHSPCLLELSSLHSVGSSPGMLRDGLGLPD